MGRPLGAVNKRLPQWQLIEAAKERKIELAKTKTREAIDRIKAQHNGHMSIDAILKMNQETLELVATRLHVRVCDGLTLDREEIQSLKDINSILLSTRAIEKELHEAITDEELLAIVNGSDGEVTVSIDSLKDSKENK